MLNEKANIQGVRRRYHAVHLPPRVAGEYERESEARGAAAALGSNTS